jgi:hypothetical protein
MSRQYTLSPKKKKRKSAPSYKDSGNQQSAQDYANSLLDSFQKRQDQSFASMLKQTPKAIASTAAAMDKADAASRSNRIGFLEEFGQRARAAAFKANPELQGSLDRYNSGTNEAASALGEAANAPNALLSSLTAEAANRQGNVANMLGRSDLLSELNREASLNRPSAVGNTLADSELLSVLNKNAMSAGPSVIGNTLADSQLLSSLNTNAMGAGPSAISQALQQSALDELALGGRLSADEARNVEQASRAAFSARGLARSNPAIVAEVMNRDAAQRARLGERRGFASGVNQQLLGEQAQNRDFASNVEQMNRAAAGQRASLTLQELAQNRDFASNVEQMNRAAAGQRASLTLQELAQNRDFASNVEQLNRSDVAQRAGLTLQELAQNRDFATNVEQLNRAAAAQRAGFQTNRAGLLSNAVTLNQAIDPAQQILAGPTNAGGATQGGLNLLNMSQSTPTMLTGLQDQAYGAFLNRDESRYNAALNAATAQDAARQQAGAARSAGQSAMTGSLIGAGGAIAGGLIIF